MLASMLSVVRKRFVSLARPLLVQLQSLPQPSHLVCRTAHHYHDHTLTYRFGMDVVYFRRHPADDGQVHIHFHYVNRDLQLDRVFNLSRSAHEPASVCVHRIHANVAKELQRKVRRDKKKTKGVDAAVAPPPPAETVELLRDGRAFVDADGSGPETVHQLLDGRSSGMHADLVLNVCGSQFKVAYNLPWVNAITLPNSVLAGYFVYPTKMELIGCDYHEADFEWFVVCGKITAVKNIIFHCMILSLSREGRHIRCHRLDASRNHLSVADHQ